jgi:hypothetical protein
MQAEAIWAAQCRSVSPTTLMRPRRTFAATRFSPRRRRATTLDLMTLHLRVVPGEPQGFFNPHPSPMLHQVAPPRSFYGVQCRQAAIEIGTALRCWDGWSST